MNEDEKGRERESWKAFLEERVLKKAAKTLWKIWKGRHVSKNQELFVDEEKKVLLSCELQTAKSDCPTTDKLLKKDPSVYLRSRF